MGEKDRVRIEAGELEAEQLHELMTEAYSILGYNPVYVPVMSVGERADFIVKGGEENDIAK